VALSLHHLHAGLGKEKQKKSGVCFYTTQQNCRQNKIPPQNEETNHYVYLVDKFVLIRVLHKGAAVLPQIANCLNDVRAPSYSIHQSINQSIEKKRHVNMKKKGENC
jgi:hypothetical protein